jgi:hypothetical protein
LLRFTSSIASLHPHFARILCGIMLVPASRRFFDGNGDCRIAGQWACWLSQAKLQGGMAT